MSELPKYDGKTWVVGVAGGCNIVTYNGEDIRGVGYIGDPVTCAEVVRMWNTRHTEGARVEARHWQMAVEEFICRILRSPPLAEEWADIERRAIELAEGK